MAIELNRIFPGSKFAARIARGNPAEDFIKKQTDIKYERIYDWRVEVNNFLSREPDYELLRRFEETLPEKSLWRIFAMDRGWGYQFCKGVHLAPHYIRKINSHDNILKMASGLIKFYTMVIEEFKPDVFIPTNGQSSMSCPIVERLCKNYNILYLVPEIGRVQNYEILTDNKQYTFPQINDTYRKLIKGEVNLDLSAGEKIYNEMMSGLDNQEKYNFLVSYIDSMKTGRPVSKFLFCSARAIIKEFIHWFKDAPLRNNKNTIFRQAPGIRTLIENIYQSTVVYYRRMQLLNPKFYGKELEPGQKYLYFPLHSPNEYSTQIQGTMWVNQLTVIEALAQSIPFDWKVVVKEHPGTLHWRTRPKAFYDEIKRYSNVVFVPVDSNTHSLISNAQIVATIIGTTGWEAILRDIPVIDLEENMYDCLNLSRRCTDIKQFSRVIGDEIKRIRSIPKEEKKRRIVCLLTAIAKHGFWIDDPLKMAGEAECSDQEAFKYGRIAACAVKDFIEYEKAKNVVRH